MLMLILFLVTGKICWQLEFKQLHYVLYFIYLPMLPIIISIISIKPNSSYGGMAFLAAIFFLLISVEGCRSNGVGGVSMIQLAISTVGVLASITGIGIFWLIVKTPEV